MGQKVHPIGFRLGGVKTWNSKWFAEKNFAGWLHEDLHLRDFIKKKIYHAGISKVEIERATNRIAINIHTARPGIVIGKRGSGVDSLKQDLEQRLGKQIDINIHEVRRAEIDSQLIAENVALQLERRVSFRRAVKKSVASALKLGTKGIKIRVAGRLGGAEMARKEWYREGRLPLHTLRADIDFGFATAYTTYGVIGVKVWVFNGEVFPEDTRRDH